LLILFDAAARADVRRAANTSKPSRRVLLDVCDLAERSALASGLYERQSIAKVRRFARGES
jgi:hypothetical protein